MLHRTGPDFRLWDRLLLCDVGTGKLQVRGHVAFLTSLLTLATPIWSWRSYIAAVIKALMITF